MYRRLHFTFITLAYSETGLPFSEPKMIWTSLKYLALAIGLSNALPAEDSPTCGSPVELNNLTGRYTLTAYAPGNVVYHGLKVNNLNLFQEKVFQYCPFTGNQSSYCPNGTDMAFGGTLGPVSNQPSPMLATY